MFETRRIVPMAVAAILVLTACGMALEFPKIDRRPEAAQWGRGKLTSVPHFDPNSTNSFQVDLRCYDLSDLDLKDRAADLLRADFDDRTTWPPAERMPKDSDYKQITELGKNPGLGVRALHKQGITEVTQKAKAAGMLVICSSVEQVHGFAFHGLGRPVTASPDDFNVYEPGLWWAQDYYKDRWGKPNRLLVPMDSRTTASPTGKTEYVFYAQGGWSWSIPHIAGAYTLAAQVEPKITPERFWALALKTGRTIKLRHDGKERDFGPILDPVRLIEAIRRGELADTAAATAELAKYYRPIPVVAQGKVTKELAAKLDAVNIENATRKDVVEQLGAPSYYALGNDMLDPNNLPSRYAMVYAGSAHVVIMDDRILRVTILSPGYLFCGKVQVSSSLDEVHEVLGPPRKTIEGARTRDIMTSPEDDVLHKNLDGTEGNSVYQARVKGVGGLAHRRPRLDAAPASQEAARQPMSVCTRMPLRAHFKRITTDGAAEMRVNLARASQAAQSRPAADRSQAIFSTQSFSATLFLCG